MKYSQTWTKCNQNEMSIVGETLPHFYKVYILNWIVLCLTGLETRLSRWIWTRKWKPATSACVAYCIQQEDVFNLSLRYSDSTEIKTWRSWSEDVICCQHIYILWCQCTLSLAVSLIFSWTGGTYCQRKMKIPLLGSWQKYKIWSSSCSQCFSSN